MDMYTLPSFIEHINSFIHHHVNKGQHILLLLDGHSSRNCLQWLHLCEKYNIISFRLLSNTTKSLQPCGQYVNRSFKRELRRLRDELLTIAPITTSNMSLKIKLAMGGYKAITSEHIKSSYKKCVLRPMDYSFMQKYEQQDFSAFTKHITNHTLIDSPVASIVPSV